MQLNMEKPEFSSGSLAPGTKLLATMLFCVQRRILRNELKAWQGFSQP